MVECNTHPHTHTLGIWQSWLESAYLSQQSREKNGNLLIIDVLVSLNSSCPRAQNVKRLCYSQSKNRLHRKPLYFVMSIVGTGNRESKFEWWLQSALGCDELNAVILTSNYLFLPFYRTEWGILKILQIIFMFRQFKILQWFSPLILNYDLTKDLMMNFHSVVFLKICQ